MSKETAFAPIYFSEIIDCYKSSSEYIWLCVNRIQNLNNVSASFIITPLMLFIISRFCRELGLPTRLKDLGLGNITDQQLLEVGNTAMHPNSVIHSVPLELSAKLIADAIRTADQISSSL